MLDRQSLKSALTGSSDCLRVEQLERLTEEQLRNHPHVALCPRCQNEVSLLRAFESDTPLPGEGAAVAWIGAQLEKRVPKQLGLAIASSTVGATAQSGTWFSRILGLDKIRILLPVTAVLVLGGAVLILRYSKEPELQAGNIGQQPAIYRSQEVETIAPVGDLQQTPESLRWVAFPGAADYQVTMMEVDRTEMWSSQTVDNSVTIPASIRAKLIPRKPVLWQVRARDPQGKILASSQTQRFVVSPEILRNN